MPAGVIQATTPYCRACGWDFILINTGDDSVCDSCGDTLAFSLGGGGIPPTDLVAALGTDEVVFTWTEALDTSDVQYRIDGGTLVFDDDASSPYTVAAPAVASVSLQVRTVTDATEGPWSAAAVASSGQSPPTVLVASAASLAVTFAFTPDPAGDSVDLFYTIDAAGDTTVLGVVTGVSVPALEGEVVEGQVRTVEDGVAGLFGTADSETALA